MSLFKGWQSKKIAKRYVSILTDIDVLVENAKMFKESINNDESLDEEAKLHRFAKTNDFIENSAKVQEFIVRMGSILYGMELKKEETE